MMVTQEQFLWCVLFRMMVCLLLGALMFGATFVAIGFIEKTIHSGLWEACSGILRALTSLTVWLCVRLISLSGLLSLIACVPVYAGAGRAPIRPVWMITCSALAALALAGYLSIEAWYWFGDRAFPPPGLVLALAAAGLASAYTSQAILSLGPHAMC